MVKALKEWYGYSIQEGCQLVDLPRSSYYYVSHKPDESQLERDLKTVAGQFPRYGSRRLFDNYAVRPMIIRLVVSTHVG